MAFWWKTLRKGVYKKTATGKTEHDWKLRETWEDYPVPDYNAMHTYCEIAFPDSEILYYYRTRNPELKVGDKVYVPFGYKYEQKVGTIISMKEYKGKYAPYPLEKTKYIKEKI